MHVRLRTPANVFVYECPYYVRCCSVCTHVRCCIASANGHVYGHVYEGATEWVCTA